MRSSYLLIFILILFVNYSCTDDQCHTDTESLVETELIAKGVDQEFIDSISIYSPEWVDSIHYLPEGTDNIIGFTLSPNSDTTEIIYASPNAINDTLSFYYQRKITYLSPECGFVIDYIIDTVIHTYNNIDSIEVATEEITTEDNGDIKIYL